MTGIRLQVTGIILRVTTIILGLEWVSMDPDWGLLGDIRPMVAAKWGHTGRN